MLKSTMQINEQEHAPATDRVDAADRSLREGGSVIAVEQGKSENHLIAARGLAVQ